jgi:hypothetical protein
VFPHSPIPEPRWCQAQLELAREQVPGAAPGHAPSLAPHGVQRGQQTPLCPAPTRPLNHGRTQPGRPLVQLWLGTAPQPAYPLVLTPPRLAAARVQQLLALLTPELLASPPLLLLPPGQRELPRLQPSPPTSMRMHCGTPQLPQGAVLQQNTGQATQRRGASKGHCNQSSTLH